MKSFLTLFLLLIFTSLFAQKSLVLPIAEGLIINQANNTLNIQGATAINNNVVKLLGGTLNGHFLGKKKPSIMVINNTMGMNGREEEFCYTTYTIDVSKVAEVAFSIDISGTGTLDKQDGPNGENWHDWIDISYVLDGEKTQLGDGNHTIEGLPTNFAIANIKTDKARKFQIEICMRNTGPDEWFSIKNIKVDLLGIENNLTIADRMVEDEKEHVFAASNSSNTPTLVVFPNPTTNYLEIKNSENYDLKMAMIFDATGKSVQLKNSYPFDLTGLPAGTYFLKCLEKESKKLMTISFVIAQN